MKKISPFFVSCVLFIMSCSHEKNLIRKASNAVERSDFDKAIGYYDQVLQRDSSSYYANAGKGIVLSEYVGKHGEAIPYLEKALKKSPQEVVPKLELDLGKSYHFIGNYVRALYYYGKASEFNKPDAIDYDQFLNKRIADCKYAIDHPQVAPAEQASIKNIGLPVNSSMPEYGPMYTHGELIFTSKRQDTPNEKKNGLDGRYFENIYTSTLNGDGTFSTPRIYKVKEPAVRLRKYAESAVSVSHDGNTLIIFNKGKLYQVSVNDSVDRPVPLNGNINFETVQNHACFSADGNTLIFSSISAHGGRSDLYKSVKDADGKWSDPELLDYAINSEFDEEAPYLNESGTLFFASNGLPGYGGFDVYKTRFVNGKWTTPENLGQPINSPGDDIYFVLNNHSSNGYYASVRPGGMGDMDIYKVHYVLNDVPECESSSSPLVLNATPGAGNPMAYNISLDVPQSYRQGIRGDYAWSLNGEPLSQTADNFSYTFAGPGTYTLSARIVMYCDTCPSLVAYCADKSIVIESQMPLASSEGEKAQDQDAGKNNGSNNKNNNNASPAPSINGSNQPLTDSQLAALGWSASPAYFDFNSSELRADAKSVLDQDINVLKNNPNMRVSIDGFADSRGTEAYNKNLSVNRANAVKQYLLSKGIAGKRIKSVTGYGETELVNNCSDGVECSDEEHQLNRRVKFDVYGSPLKTQTNVVLK